MSDPVVERTAPVDAAAGPPRVGRGRRAVIDLLNGGPLALIAPIVAAIVLIAFPLFSSDAYWLREIPLIAVFALVVSGVNLSFGYAGELQFGQVFMFALGSYVTMYLATHGFNQILPLVLIGGLVASLVGAVIALPALRIGGWALAMASFFLVICAPDLITLLSRYTGGDVGLFGIPVPSLFGLALGDKGIYVFSAVVGVIWLGLYRNLVTSRYGVTFRVLRQSPVLAQSLGFSTLRLKLMAYGLGAFPAGMAGCLYGYISLLLVPGDFGINLAIGIVAASVLGGVESVYGLIVGAAILELGPERSLSFASYAPIAYGGFLVVAAVLLRSGIGGLGKQWAGRLATRLAGGESARIALTTDIPAEAAAAHELVVASSAPMPALAGATLAVAGVTKSFGAVRALSEVTLSAEPGQVTALIGANGSGKTTLLNAICGLIPADTGTIRLGAERISGIAPHRVAARGIGRTFQTPALPTGTTVLDVVACGRFHANPCHPLVAVLRLPAYHRARRADREEALAALALVGLEDLAGQDASSLSLGTRRLIEVARSLCGRPGVLLLDEPASGLSDEEVRRLGRVITAAARAGATVVLIEHNFGFVSDVSDVIHVLHLGTLIATGTAAQIAGDASVVESYLGGDTEAPARVDRARQAAEEAVPVLEVRAAVGGYGDLKVLQGVDLSIRAGEVEAVLGRNGVGKTTLLNVISGQISLWSGDVSLAGESLAHRPAYRRAAAGIALVQEGKRIFRHRTIAENVELGTHSLKLSHAERAQLCRDVLAQFPVLEGRAGERAGGLSGGQQQMLAIAQALAARPKVLLLDEPSAGLAPSIVSEVFAHLRRLADDGLAIIVVEQLADRAIAIADHVTVLDGGRVVRSGAPEDFDDRDQLQEAYFGSPAAH